MTPKALFIGGPHDGEHVSVQADIREYGTPPAFLKRFKETEGGLEVHEYRKGSDNPRPVDNGYPYYHHSATEAP